jgi:RNA polymerase sigma-70 factor (ECF subfamily)
MLGNTHDAEDITQQALLAGFTDINELRSSEKFGVWLSRITRNLCIDFRRRQNRKRRVLRQQATPRAGDSKVEGRLDDTLAKLPAKYRIALMLYYFDGRSAKNIAETLDISQAAVCTRLARGRKQLRQLLEGEGDK